MANNIILIYDKTPEIRPPLYIIKVKTSFPFPKPMVAAIEGFHCNLNFKQTKRNSTKGKKERWLIIQSNLYRASPP